MLSAPGRTLWLMVVVTAVAASPAVAQSTGSSKSYFLLGPAKASGGLAQSTSYKMEAAFGESIPAKVALSTNFRMTGGIMAAGNVPVAGHPWVSGIFPTYASLLGGTTHAVHGHELALGAGTTAVVGGVAASVLSRTADKVTVRLPKFSSPGWKPVAVTNSGGTAWLIPKGLGVLPLAELPWPIATGEPWRLTYRGAQGDIVYLVVTSARLPLMAPIMPYHHGLELNLGTLVALIGPLPVVDPSGIMNIDFGGFPFPRPLYVQMLALPTKSAGYNPGSFTNVVTL